MLRRALTVGASTMIWATTAFAQERGTMELGGFGSGTQFNKSLALNSGYGAGGRVGMFLAPSLSVEFDGSAMNASRTLGLSDVRLGLLSSRLTAVPVKAGRLSFLVGAGAGIGTETNFLRRYTLGGLVGAKVALTDNAALRIDGTSDWLANDNWKSFQSVRVGVSLYRHPRTRVNTITRTVTIQGPPASVVVLPDSVSAEEQARLRRIAADYRALRDSLVLPITMIATPVSSASALSTMNATIQFATDKSVLTAEAKTGLDSKVNVFRANPSMRIVIVGNTDERASDTYNMGLGERRAAAAKTYLVSQGVDQARIEVSSLGERSPTAVGTSKDAQATNRRDEFRLLIASDFLVPPIR